MMHSPTKLLNGNQASYLGKNLWFKIRTLWNTVRPRVSFPVHQTRPTWTNDDPPIIRNFNVQQFNDLAAHLRLIYAEQSQIYFQLLPIC